MSLCCSVVVSLGVVQMGQSLQGQGWRQLVSGDIQRSPLLCPIFCVGLYLDCRACCVSLAGSAQLAMSACNIKHNSSSI